MDASHVRAKEVTAPRRAHLISDSNGFPLNVITTAANVNDGAQTLNLVDGVPPVVGRVGHPPKRRDALLGDKGNDSEAIRRE